MRLILLIVDFFIILITWIASCVLVMGPRSFEYYVAVSIPVLPVLFFLKIIFFARFGLYSAILRYAGFPFATTLVKAVTLGSGLSYLTIDLFTSSPSSGVFVMDWLMTLFFVGAPRFYPRYYSEIINQSKEAGKKVLIYGAGDVGDALARSLLKQKTEYLPVGFIDDDLKKVGKKVHNLPVLGSRTQLGKILKKYKITELIIAISSTPSEWLRDLIKECRSDHVFCRIAPKISDMMDHEVNIKNIDIVDLLKRDPKDLDEKQIDRFLRGKKILISGAAGSIGSELVRQVIRFKPRELVLVDISEFGLYSLQEELAGPNEKIPPDGFKFVLHNLCDEGSIENLIRDEKPNIILHAAAYKHVPLVEENPFIGIVNNIKSTINIAKAANRHHVEKFVLISTDKAVRPTNIMGASKRICELYIQNLNLRSSTEYVAVRFGNVLGSSGSVIPKFLNQIKSGGPVTVTHPDVTRYFMLTQEAVELTLQAAAIGHGGEIFILNMGKPVKIKEMAEDLIFLAGKEPYKDIDIQFTGLRAGEKLFEELLIDDTEKKTQYTNITIAKTIVMEWDDLEEGLYRLLKAAQLEDKEKILITIQELVPEFNHVDLPQRFLREKVLALPIH